jgi:hypothetical protein
MLSPGLNPVPRRGSAISVFPVLQDEPQPIMRTRARTQHTDPRLHGPKTKEAELQQIFDVLFGDEIKSEQPNAAGFAKTKLSSKKSNN